MKTDCRRCGIICKVDPKQNSTAKMLVRGKQPKGLCLNCAVHDWLRNTYPVNLILSGSGPKALALPHIQEQFVGIMKSQGSDAEPDEINWQRIIDNWDIPFPDKMKRSSMNLVSQAELDREPEERAKREYRIKNRMTLSDEYKKEHERYLDVINNEALPLFRKLDQE